MGGRHGAMKEWFDRPDNGALVCRTCHTSIHDQPWKFEAKWFVSKDKWE